MKGLYEYMSKNVWNRNPETHPRLFSGATSPATGAADSGLCLDLPTIVSEVVADSVSALPEVCALASKCRTLIEAARTKNAFRTEFDAFSLRKLKQIRETVVVT